MSTNVNTLIADRIRSSLKERDVSQVELAQMIQKSRAYVSNITKGRYVPKISELIKIAEYLKKPDGYWSYEIITEEAAKYSSRVEFQRGNSMAYRAAVKLGIIEEISQHMERPLSDKDAVYIWRAINERYNGNPVYKIGITSARLGKQRITEGAWSSGSKAELIVMAKMPGKAVEVEAELLTLGDNPGYSGFCGSTEFRALSDNDLDKSLAIIQSATNYEYLHIIVDN